MFVIVVVFSVFERLSYQFVTCWSAFLWCLWPFLKNVHGAYVLYLFYCQIKINKYTNKSNFWIVRWEKSHARQDSRTWSCDNYSRLTEYQSATVLMKMTENGFSFSNVMIFCLLSKYHSVLNCWMDKYVKLDSGKLGKLASFTIFWCFID